MKAIAIQHFWTWFLEHKAKLKMLPQLNVKEQKYYTHWLDWHLQFYCRGIEYILVFPKHKNKKTELLISAKGNQELFKTAIELDKTAPNLWDWKFTALIQSRDDYDDMEVGIGAPYIFRDITLKVEELKFIPLEYDGEKKIDMVVYMKNFTIYSHNKNLPTLINIFQDLFGEKSMGESISFVQLAQMPDCEGDLIYLYDLQNYIDETNKSRA